MWFCWCESSTEWMMWRGSHLLHWGPTRLSSWSSFVLPFILYLSVGSYLHMDSHPTAMQVILILSFPSSDTHATAQISACLADIAPWIADLQQNWTAAHPKWFIHTSGSFVLPGQPFTLTVSQCAQPWGNHGQSTAIFLSYRYRVMLLLISFLHRNDLYISFHRVHSSIGD